MSCNTEVSVESYLHEQIGRRLAEDRLSSSGDIATDREDSPLQSKRSSMSSKTFKFSINCLFLTMCFTSIYRCALVLIKNVIYIFY